MEREETTPKSATSEPWTHSLVSSCKVITKQGDTIHNSPNNGTKESPHIANNETIKQSNDNPIEQYYNSLESNDNTIEQYYNIDTSHPDNAGTHSRSQSQPAQPGTHSVHRSGLPPLLVVEDQGGAQGLAISNDISKSIRQPESALESGRYHCRAHDGAWS